MPVRNGERTLARALRNILDQTYRDLEVIISDNCSTDNTAAIAAQFVRADSRVSYLRQPNASQVWRHFGVVTAQVESEYLMWAADDDMRNETYVEQLITALDDHPQAVLAFGSVVHFYEDDDTITPVTATAKDYGWDGESRYDQLTGLFRKCARFYGVFRNRYVQEYPWFDIDTEYGPDVAFLLYARMRGQFVYVPGAVFQQAVPAGTYHPSQRAQEHYFRNTPSFAIIRLAWCCMKGAAAASKCEALPTRRLRTFVLSYAILKRDHTKIWLFPRLPRPLVAGWRRYKGWRRPQGSIDGVAHVETAVERNAAPATLPADTEPRPLAPLPR